MEMQKITYSSTEINVRKTRISSLLRVKGLVFSIPGNFCQFPISEYPAMKETIAILTVAFCL